MRVIITRGAYGFGHDWTLEAYGRKYYLGQDAKFCSRVLGFSPSTVVAKIGSAEIETPAVNNRLARLICEELGVTRSSKLEPWALCAQ
jgi:hypothetical protein